MNKQTLKTLGTALVLSLSIHAAPANAVETNPCSWFKNTASCDVGSIKDTLSRLFRFG